MSHYDFIEIGTSDFATLLQHAKPHHRGISVEPNKFYLDRLPDHPNVRKVCVAIGQEEGTLPMYHITEEDRTTHGLPDWVKGCSRIGMVHPSVVNWLKKHSLPQSLIKKEDVPIITLKKLFNDYEVEAVDFVKIDAEGYDLKIMKDLLKLIEEGIHVKKIKFETAPILSELEEVIQIIGKLEELGYSCRRTQRDTYASLPE